MAGAPSLGNVHMGAALAKSDKIWVRLAVLFSGGGGVCE